MDLIIKAFGGVFVLLLLAVSGVQMIHSTIEANEADNFFSEATKMMSESRFAESVVSECVENAKQRGYELSVTPYYINGSKRKCGSVSMQYLFELPMFGIIKEYQLENDVW